LKETILGQILLDWIVIDFDLKVGLVKCSG
jgi:hypothetical protein